MDSVLQPLPSRATDPPLTRMRQRAGVVREEPLIVVMQTPPFRFTSQQQGELRKILQTFSALKPISHVIKRLEQHVWLYRERQAHGAMEDRNNRAHQQWLKRVDRQVARLEAVIRGRLPDGRISVMQLLRPRPSVEAVESLRIALRTFRSHPRADTVPSLHVRYPYDLALVLATGEILEDAGLDLGKGKDNEFRLVLSLLFQAVGRRKVTQSIVLNAITDVQRYLPEWRATPPASKFARTWRYLGTVQPASATVEPQLASATR